MRPIKTWRPIRMREWVDEVGQIVDKHLSSKIRAYLWIHPYRVLVMRMLVIVVTNGVIGRRCLVRKRIVVPII
jgi:hypothetical protein